MKQKEGSECQQCAIPSTEKKSTDRDKACCDERDMNVEGSCVCVSPVQPGRGGEAWGSRGTARGAAHVGGARPARQCGT